MQLPRVFGLDETHSAKRRAQSDIWRDVRSGETSETAEERGQEVEVKGKKKGILLWERLSSPEPVEWVEC